MSDLSGIVLYDKIEPVLQQGFSNGITFITEISTIISAYVTANDFFEGTYNGQLTNYPYDTFHTEYNYDENHPNYPAGYTIPPVNSLHINARSSLIPVGTLLKTDNGSYFNYINWLKDSFSQTMTWNIVPSVTHPEYVHQFSPYKFIPLESAFEALGDLSDLRSHYGVWALLCDLMIFAILRSEQRINGGTQATLDNVIVSTDTLTILPEINQSKGKIKWGDTDPKTLKHNFCISVYNDGSNDILNFIHKYILEDVEENTMVDVPITNITYREALGIYKTTKAITKIISFYKIQKFDDTGKIAKKVVLIP